MNKKVIKSKPRFYKGYLTVKGYLRENWRDILPAVIYLLLIILLPLIFPIEKNKVDYIDSDIPQEYLEIDSVKTFYRFDGTLVSID
jgi:hypothetical protein